MTRFVLVLLPLLAAAPSATAGDAPAAEGATTEALVADLRAACEKGKKEERAAAADALATRAGVIAPTEAGENAGYRFSARERASALAALRWARLRFDLDPDRVLVTGSSRGGHMSWDLALRHPGLFAAAAPMIGAPRMAT